MSTRLPDGPTTQGTLARMTVDELTGKHCREFRRVDDTHLAVQTYDGQWALWRRESDRRHAVRLGDYQPPVQP